MALYDNNFGEKLLFNIRVKPGEKESVIYESSVELLPEAILINANNKGYGRIVMDENSIRFFCQNLSKIQNTVNRSLIWRALPDQMLLLRLKPIEFMECIIKNIGAETQDLILPFILEQMHFLLKFYLS